MGPLCSIKAAQLTPTTSRVVLKPPTTRQRAKDAAQLHAEVLSTRRFEVHIGVLSACDPKGPQRFVESGLRQAEAQTRARSGERPASPDVPHSRRRRWWRFELLARQDAPVTVATKSGAELKVLGPYEVKDGAAIADTQGTDHQEGPKDVNQSEERVFILSKSGAYYFENPAGWCSSLKQCSPRPNKRRRRQDRRLASAWREPQQTPQTTR